MDRFLSVVHENWTINDHPTLLAAYALWRLNWIHPFTDGNGRTSRALSYLIMCVRLGYRLPGPKSIPELLAENKQPYYDALERADEADRDGRLDLSAMEDLLAGLLAKQLLSTFEQAGGGLVG